MESSWARRTVRGGPEANPTNPGKRTDDAERIDFDRVLMDSWRPRSVTAQSEIPDYVPGPGSEPPRSRETERDTNAFWLVDQRRALAGLGIVVTALLLVSAAAFQLGISLARDETPLEADEHSLTPPTASVQIGAFEVTPLSAAAAIVPPPPHSPEAPASVAAAEPGPPPILPIPSSDRQERARAPESAATERPRRSRARTRAVAEQRQGRSQVAASAASAEAAAEAATVEPPRSIGAASLAGWDEVLPTGSDSSDSVAAAPSVDSAPEPTDDSAEPIAAVVESEPDASLNAPHEAIADAEDSDAVEASPASPDGVDADATPSPPPAPPRSHAPPAADTERPPAHAPLALR